MLFERARRPPALTVFGSASRAADRPCRRRTDTHAALQSEQDFHLTAHVNPGLLDIFLVVFRYPRRAAPQGHCCFAFDEKRGRNNPHGCGEVRTACWTEVVCRVSVKNLLFLKFQTFCTNSFFWRRAKRWKKRDKLKVASLKFRVDETACCNAAFKHFI